MIKSFYSKQFVFFLLTGGIAALVNFLSRIVYNLKFSFSTSIVLAYITGMITAYILAKFFVFKKNTQQLHKSIFYFCLVNLFAILQTWLVSMGLAYYALPALGIILFVPEIAHGVGVLVPVFTSFLGHKHLSFREGAL